MKRLIICEGKYDGIFMEILFKRLGIRENEVKVFSQKNVSLKDKRNAESIMLKKFTENHSHNPYKFLVKLEGGKNPAIKIFCRELIRCLNHVDRLILLLDVDSGSVLDKIESLKNVVNKHYSSTTPINLVHQEKNKTDHLHHSLINVYMVEGEKEIGEFQVIFFNNSLEKSCGIIKDEHEHEEKIKRIEEFIIAKKISDFFSPIFK